MVDSRFLLVLVSIIFLVVGFRYKNYVITALGSILMIIMGVFTLITGLPYSSSFMNLGFGLIIFGVGSYVFVKVNMEQYEGVF